MGRTTRRMITSGVDTSSSYRNNDPDEILEEEEDSGFGSALQSSSSCSSSSRTPKGFDKVELTRLLIQSIDSLGYTRSAQALAEESQQVAITPNMQKFRKCLLQGDWQGLERILNEDKGAWKNEESEQVIRFKIYKQKFLEMLFHRDMVGALEVMRNELRFVCREKRELHELSLLLLCKDAEEVMRISKWGGANDETRLECLEEIRPFISSRVLLEENRLEKLLVQALKWQKQVSMYPFTEFTHECLLEDLKYCPQKIPKKTLVYLAKHDDQVWYLKFSNNGKFLASASRDHTVIIWDMAMLKPNFTVYHSVVKYVLKGHDDAVSYLAWSPDDSKLLSVSMDKSIRLWNMNSGKCDKVFNKHVDEIGACAWLPDGKHFISGGYGKQMFEWNIDTEDCIDWETDVERISDICITKNGEELIMITAQKEIMIYDIKTRKVVHKIEVQESLAAISLSRNSKYLLVIIAEKENSEMQLWDLDHYRLVKKFKGYSQERFIIRGTFGGYEDMFIACGSEDKKVYLWHRNSKKVLATLEGHKDIVNCVAWSPTDHSMLASASDDRTVRIWGPADEPEINADGEIKEDDDEDDEDKHDHDSHPQSNGMELVAVVSPTT